MSKYFSSNQTSDSLPYDNTTSGLTAENAKDAIDELGSEKLDKSDNLLVNPQVVVVKISNAGAGEFTDLALAVASITDADPDTKPYVIEMGAGNFSVNNPIVLPTGVSLRGEGINATSISPTDPNEHLLIPGAFSEVSFLNLKGIVGSIGSGKAALYFEDVGDFGQIHKVSIYDFDIGIEHKSTTTSSNLYIEYADVNGDFSYAIKATSSGGFDNRTQVENFYTYESTTPNAVAISGTGTALELQIFSTKLFCEPTQKGIVTSNGVVLRCNSLDIQGAAVAVQIENIGTGGTINTLSTALKNNAIDYKLDHPNTTGSIFGGANLDNSQINATANVSVFLLDQQNEGIALNGKIFYSKDSFSNLTDISQLITNGPTMGLIVGGMLSVSSGLTISIASGFGYQMTGVEPDDILHRRDWATQTLLLPANSNRYVYMNDVATFVSGETLPDTEENILLGRVITNATDIMYIEQVPMNAHHFNNKIDQMFRRAIGGVFHAGSTTAETGTRQLAVTAGEYYFSDRKFTPSGGSPITFDSFYRSASPGVYTRTTGVTTVDRDNYDDGSGTLALVPSGKHTKHLLLMLGGPSEKYALVYATTFYNTQAEAETAPLPLVPSFMSGSFVRIAGLVVGPNHTNILTITDERPRIGFASSSSSGSITDHGALSGLGDDDHGQYTLVSGARAMTGSLDMGGNNIINVSLVDGIDITSHASRHAFNGLDPFLSATPQTVGTTNAEGVDNTHFARADHVHAHGNQTGPTQHAVATTGANGFMSSTDKTKLDGIGGNRIIKAGVVAGATFAGAPRTATVTFGTAMPNTNYSIAISGANSRSWSYQTKTVNGFVINSNANTALSGEVTWTCISHGESVE